MPFLCFKPAPLIGVDINSDEIRLLQLTKMKTQWRVENFALAELPQGAMVDGKIKQVAEVQAALTNLVQQTHLQGCSAAIALPANIVISKRIKLAACLHKRELEMKIHTNLAYYLPGITEKLAVDFVDLGNFDTNYQQALLIASRADQVKIYHDLVKQAGLKVKIIDVDCYALIRAITLDLPLAVLSNVQIVVAVLDVGIAVTQFIVFQQDNIIFSQYWQTEAISLTIANLQRALELYSTTHGQAKLAHLIISGKQAHLLDIHLIQQQFNITTVYANPFQHMLLSSKVNASTLQYYAAQLLICCGLAMRSV